MGALPPLVRKALPIGLRANSSLAPLFLTVKKTGDQIRGHLVSKAPLSPRKKLFLISSWKILDWALKRGDLCMAYNTKKNVAGLDTLLGTIIFECV